METMENNLPNLYERAAVNGCYLGLYLTVLFFANAFTQTVPVLAFAGLLLMIGVPVVMYRWLSASYRRMDCMPTFSEIWLEGIATFFFGTLIVSVVSVVYMMWIHPDWLVGQMRAAIAQGEASGVPQLEEMAALLTTAMEERVMPSPIQLALDMGWLILFTGSILSMCLAGIVRARIKKNM